MTARGLASRREADDWIAAGWVRVDGKLAVLGQRVGPEQRIDIDPRARNEQARSVTILLNKPVGYVSGQAEDGYEPAVVLVKPEPTAGPTTAASPSTPATAPPGAGRAAGHRLDRPAGADAGRSHRQGC